MYDAIIVGARCGGSPTAMLLAQRGYRVLLVDRASFPSDTPKGHYIQPSGVLQLERWGLLQKVLDSGCPPAREIRFDLGEFALRGAARLPNGRTAIACSPRRSVLDAILVEAAVAAGAELRQAFAVEDLLWADDRVVGLRGRSRGRPIEESARIVIGADGVHSRVAAVVEAPIYDDRGPLTGAYWSYWSGLEAQGLEIYPRDGALAVAFPTNDNLVLVGAQWRHSQFESVRAHPEQSLFELLEQAPDLAERVRSGRREEPWYGRLDLYNFFRKPFGPGWALVGDAGYLKDPITGQGIGDAFRDAELLADAIDDGFAGRHSLEAALAGYEQRRNTASGPIYNFSCDLARLEPPPPEMQRLFGALRENPHETSQFLGVIGGLVPFERFFARDNIKRITACAEPVPVA